MVARGGEDGGCGWTDDGGVCGCGEEWGGRDGGGGVALRKVRSKGRETSRGGDGEEVGVVAEVVAVVVAPGLG